MSRLIDTQLDGNGDIILSRNDVEIARVDGAGNVATKGTVNGGSIAASAPSGDVTGAADTGVLQAAINAAAAAGKRLDLLQGTYYFTALTLPSGAHIRGMGRELTILKQAAATDAIGISNASPGSGGNNDITLEGFQIDGNKANRTSSKAMCVITGTQAAVQSGNCNRIVFRDIYAHDAAALGLVFQNVIGGEITNCHVANNARDGITLYFDCQNVTISDCYVHDCADDFLGLNAEDASSTGHVMKNITVTNCVLAGGQTTQGSCLAVRGCTNSTFSNLVLGEGFSSGIVISNANTTAAAGLLFDNIAIVDAGKNNSGGSGHGIEITGSTTVINSGGEAGVSNVALRNLYISNPRAMGILLNAVNLNGPISDVEIAGGVISCGSLFASGRGVSGVTGFLTRIRLRDLTIKNAQTNGINVGHATNATTDIRICDCIVTGSGTGSSATAISLTNVNGLIFSRNKSSGGAGQTFGLTVATPTGDYVITDNDCTGNATGTFSLSGMASCTDTKIANNTGFSPWAGTGTVGTLSNVVSGGVTTFFRDLAVTFGVPFPTAYTPNVQAQAVAFTGAGTEISAVSNTGCTIRVWSMRSDLSAITAAWVAA